MIGSSPSGSRAASSFRRPGERRKRTAPVAGPYWIRSAERKAGLTPAISRAFLNTGRFIRITNQLIDGEMFECLKNSWIGARKAGWVHKGEPTVWLARIPSAGMTVAGLAPINFVRF
jgi:hypothetical protein